RLVNFAHGAQFMLGAFAAVFLLRYFGLNYWAALVIVPPIAGIVGIALERLLLRPIHGLNSAYGALMTVGIAFVIEGLIRHAFGSSIVDYPAPAQLQGGISLDAFFIPTYRLWVFLISLAMSLGAWIVLRETSFGHFLRSPPEGGSWLRAPGVGRMLALTYGFGAGLAALAGVLAAPIYSVHPGMGLELIGILFALVLVAGQGSIPGVIATGLVLGIV